MNRRLPIVIAAIAAVAVALVVWLRTGEPSAPSAADEAADSSVSTDGARRIRDARPSPSSAAEDVSVEETCDDDGEAAELEDEDAEPAEEMTEEERRADEEEKLVDAFDELTDKWEEASEKGVTMADIEAFSAAFRRVPKDRRDECVHRALNLVPDENVMLLAGILMDKTMDPEIVETVFNDILNRDESVKKPILEQIYKDKTHPCWSDVAWILDVTGDSEDSADPE